MREANLDFRGTIVHKYVQILAYAEDILIVENLKMQLKMHLIDLKWKRKKWVQ